MMPIRPENRARYPKDWPAISRRIRFDRANGRCECDGRCGWHLCGTWSDNGDRKPCGAVNGQPHPQTGSRVVLTVAHLDHTPENCGDDNLAAMCQGCHLNYDAEHHAETRAASAAQARADAGQGAFAFAPAEVWAPAARTFTPTAQLRQGRPTPPEPAPTALAAR